MSELQQPPGVQEGASWRTKANMLEQNDGTGWQNRKVDNTWEASGFSVR